jgi:hypothetical protein
MGRGGESPPIPTQTTKGKYIMPLDIVYVRVKKPHFKEDTCWQCADANEALLLCRWLAKLGVEGAQRLDNEMYDAIPDTLLDG